MTEFAGNGKPPGGRAATIADLERIAKALGGASRCGEGWKCRCPAHDDPNPSLTVDLGENGTLLWRCHAGCSQAAVGDALKKRGLLMNGAAHEPKARKDKIVAVYPYVDEQKRLLFEKVRYQPKRFVQRRPDGRGGHVYKLDDTRRVLFRLPQVIEADEVWVCEGEKDADRVRSLGFVATTNVEGASEDTKKPKWRDEYSAALAGKRLILLPHNDSAGRAHMENAARCCRKAGAASIKMIRLEGLRPKGDVSDWLDAGHTADELRALAEAAPEWRPGSPEQAAEDGATTPSWEDALIFSASGTPKAVEANIATVLQLAEEFAGRLRFNELSHAAECSAMPWRPHVGWRDWTDADDIELAIWCQRRDLMAKPATCANAVQAVATKNPHHPVREYLDSLEWDGVKRIDGWLQAYLRATVAPGREEYLRQVGRKVLIQAVARIYDAGCQADHVMVLRGQQGRGKSTAIRVLAKDEAWFADEVSEIGSKDAAQDLRNKWLIELAELAAMRGRDVERTKGYVSRRFDHYRPSYGRRSQDFKRQCVFFGTTNADSYLVDETGNRRFWDVKVGAINLEALRREVDQLWAEAVAAYEAREPWHLGAEVEALAAEVQAERRIEDAWTQTVLSWADAQADGFTMRDVLVHALGLGPEQHNQSASNRVGGILRANGWEPKHGKRGNTWHRADAPDGEPPTPPVNPPRGSRPHRERPSVDAARPCETPVNPSEGSPRPEGFTGKANDFNRCEPGEPGEPCFTQYLRQRREGADGASESSATEVWEKGVHRVHGFTGPLPDWTDIDAWHARERQAKSDPGRLRKVAATWAAAAGGAIAGSALVLPRLPNCMALAELKALASTAGLEVRERLQ